MNTTQTAYTAHADDDAPSVDQNGDPRFLTEAEMQDADRRATAADDEAAQEYADEYDSWCAEQRERGMSWF